MPLRARGLKLIEKYRLVNYNYYTRDDSKNNSKEVFVKFKAIVFISLLLVFLPAACTSNVSNSVPGSTISQDESPAASSMPPRDELVPVSASIASSSSSPPSSSSSSSPPSSSSSYSSSPGARSRPQPTADNYYIGIWDHLEPVVGFDTIEPDGTIRKRPDVIYHFDLREDGTVEYYDGIDGGGMGQRYQGTYTYDLSSRLLVMDLIYISGEKSMYVEDYAYEEDTLHMEFLLEPDATFQTMTFTWISGDRPYEEYPIDLPWVYERKDHYYG